MVATQFSWLDEVARESKHAAAFKQFHLDNPVVYYQLTGMLEQMKQRGRQRIGMGMLFEVLRWEHHLNTTDEEFKLNNNYRAYYTRLIKHTRPDLGYMLTSRTSMADEDEQ